MNFRFDITKATEVACEFLKREGGTINIMKLIKLVYLLDRLSVARRGIPVVGGAYFSLPNGPITSELVDLVNSGGLWGVKECHWDDFISDRENHQVKLVKEASRDHLSDSEMDLIAAIYHEHGTKDQWQLRDWCHEHCGEWSPLQEGRERIDLEKVAVNVGKSDDEVRRIREEAAETNLLATFLARA